MEVDTNLALANKNNTHFNSQDKMPETNLIEAHDKSKIIKTNYSISPKNNKNLKTEKLDIECTNTLRGLCADMVFSAKSGHLGACLGMAPTMHVLFSRFIKVSAKDPKWINRDRFVLSNGHTCALLYSVLHLLGYDLSLQDLQRFRKFNSKTPGHPDVCKTDGIDATTGALGQGVGVAVGMAIAEKMSAARYNKGHLKLIDHKIYVFCGDGDLQEGITSEACSLAGHLRLDNLILLYDSNNVTIDGPTSLNFTENVELRFQSYGWNTIVIKNGDSDFREIECAIDGAIKTGRKLQKPTLIIIRTTIGYGTELAGSNISHGNFLDEKSYINFKNTIGLNKPFSISKNVNEVYIKAKENNNEKLKIWLNMWAIYEKVNPSLASDFSRIFMYNSLPIDWESYFQELIDGSVFDLALFKGSATREISCVVLNHIASKIPEMIGGSSDLMNSNMVCLKEEKYFNAFERNGRMISYGCREHAMFSIGNGLTTYGFIPFSATFLNFSSYGIPAIRLCAYNQYQHLFILTHDSIGLGEDGPSHQPVEIIPLLRAIPNILVLRPFNCGEVIASYKLGLEHKNGPTAILLCKQKLYNCELLNYLFDNDNVDRIDYISYENTSFGAYVMYDTEKFRKKLKSNKKKLLAKLNKVITLVATGSEVALALKTAKKLIEFKIQVRVVSCPSTKLFLSQCVEYQNRIIPPNCLSVSIEASSTLGWSSIVDYSIGVDVFGASGSCNEVMESVGLSTDKVVEKCLKFFTLAKSLNGEKHFESRNINNE